jgi:hypothetical protein
VIVVSNSNPLIAGAGIGIEAIFEALFGEVIIPPAVRQEVFTSRPQPLMPFGSDWDFHRAFCP